MTPHLKKELDKIYKKNDELYPEEAIAAQDYFNMILADIKKHPQLKDVKFKLSFWNSKTPEDIKYSVAKGFFLKDEIRSWAKMDPEYLVSFVLFGDN